MAQITNVQQQDSASSQYLTPIAAWALAFGCSVGWGAFVMPGTTFLPIAGPLGSVLGLLIGAGIMLIIGINYNTLIKRYPDAGGSYTFAQKTLGGDHGFLCGWMMILTYSAITWANATALSLIIRCLMGDMFCFGFSYRIAGYTVYFGEVLLSFAIIAICYLIVTLSKKLSAYVQICCASLLFLCILAVFIAVLVHRGGLSGMTPLFRQKISPAVQVLGIVILAPWAFIGFESICHSAHEFRFSLKRTMPIIVAALITGTLSYVMLAVCASAAHPDGFENWIDYIRALGHLNGTASIPTFFNAEKALGSTGLVLVGVAAVCGILTGIIGNFIALSRLIYRMSADNVFPEVFSRKNKHDIPYVALMLIAGSSCLIPLLGRTAIGWIVDVTTIGAVIVYTYICICVFTLGKREHNRSMIVFGILGLIFSFVFGICYLAPSVWSESSLSTQSFLILIVWSVLGMVVFRAVVRHDKARRFGKSAVVWVILFVLTLLVSVLWIYRTTTESTNVVTAEVRLVENELANKMGIPGNNPDVLAADDSVIDSVQHFSETTRHNIYIRDFLIVCALAVIFSIFNIIKKREKDIEAERLRAEENSRAKSNFLSNMSHDIRTPMNAVTGYTALALKEDNLPDNIREYLEKIDHSSKHLLSLINDILDMSRIESGKVELNTAPADLCRIMDDVVNVFSLQMESKKLNFSADHSEVKNRYVICDEHRLKRILFNLISNAYKFTPSGGAIRLSLRQTESGENEGGYELTVADTGIGMSEEFSKHVFDAFERERTQTVSKEQGTGLGMTITKSLVDLMNGSISMETSQGKGTTFTISLRFELTDADSVVQTESEDTERSIFEGKKLLVVEDNPINLEIACAILSQEGFEIDTAEDGKIAVDMVAAAAPNTYNAILMDVQMPVMGGYEATRLIRAMDGERADIPIIAITANTFESDRREAFDAGMNAHVSKPFEPTELTATLAKYMKEY